MKSPGVLCLFSVVRNPVQQHSASKETTEKSVDMELFMPGFEGERKRSTRPPMRALTLGIVRACIYDLMRNAQGVLTRLDFEEAPTTANIMNWGRA